MYILSSAPSAERDIERLKQVSRQDFQRLTRAIRALAEEPRPRGVRKIKGSDRHYRIRVRNYRIIYEIRDSEKMVTIARVLRRNETTYRT